MPKAEKDDTTLPVTTESGLPSFLQEAVNEDAGKGVSTRAEDNLVPLIYILQAQSPQCNERSPEHVPGAKTGAIWLRNSGLPAVDGTEGIIFQPCYYHIDWVEWIPRKAGGGFVGRHPERPADAIRQEDPQNPNRVKFVRPNGNEVVETRYHTGYVMLANGGVMPYVIPMTSSGHTVSRTWMFMMNSKVVGKRIAPSWSCLYHLKTKERTNAAGTWMTWDIEDAGWVQDPDDYARGKKLNASFEAGESGVEAPEEHFHAPDDDNAPM